MADYRNFFNQQLEAWSDAASRFSALDDVLTKQIEVDGLKVTVQFNPARIRSSAAKVDKASIAARPCFLCRANRPPQQHIHPWRDYEVLVNPFPICRFHLTIADSAHKPQLIADRIADMVALTMEIDDAVVFYNGPKCGASAPDHFHFQAVGAGELPLVDAIESGRKLPFGVVILDGEEIYTRFPDVLRRLKKDGEPEAMVNLLCYRRGSAVRLVIIPRCKHRPDFYGDAPGQMLVSPASIDLGGIMVAPRKADFDLFTECRLRELYAQLCYSQTELSALIGDAYPKPYSAFETSNCNCKIIASNSPKMSKIPQISVGIVEAASVSVRVLTATNDVPTDQMDLTAADIPESGSIYLDAPIGGSIEVSDVVIGIGFHWQQKKTLRFPGCIELRRRGDNILIVNHLDVETYLKSVISSEMRPTATLEFLKAHAVISRSWLLSQIAAKAQKQRPSVPVSGQPSPTESCCQKSSVSGQQLPSEAKTSVGSVSGQQLPGSLCPAQQGCPAEVVKWYDHEDHQDFDVCADDHCQRYQGITMQTTDKAREAVESTAGEVLTFGGEICDARFSKCCGGMMELFSSCWADIDFPYLQALPDAPVSNTKNINYRSPEAWIKGRPEAFCNTSDIEVLNQVLNAYDLETKDFYRWSVEYNDCELADIIRKKSGYDFGRIIALMPIERGPSGRIVRLKIVGEKLNMIVGKELEIRRWLSPTHLYSSAFTVTRIGDRLRLDGAGWGHGVGLCQIGAAVMGSQGYGYRQILAHYYPNSIVEQIYCPTAETKP